MTPILGLMRVRNISRWIERSLGSLLACCDRVLLLDDYSSDDTAERAQSMGADVIRPDRRTFSEVADRQMLWDRADDYDPVWIVAIDGDEEILDPAAARAELEQTQASIVFYRILYMWGDGLVRVDGVYANTARPSACRYVRGARYASSRPRGLHCGVLPIRAGVRVMSRVPLLHYGYESPGLRRKKFEWYTQVDPNDAAEDYYRHIAIGEPWGLPASARTRYAGPLRLKPLDEVLADAGRA